MRPSIREEGETTISSVQSGLNLEIRDKVELLPYQDLNNLVQICIKVEPQLLRKGLKILQSNSSVEKEYKRESNQVVEEEPPKNLGKEKTKRNQEKEHHHTLTLEISSVSSVLVEVTFHQKAPPRRP